MNINQLTAKAIKFYSKYYEGYEYKGIVIVWTGARYKLLAGGEYNNTYYKTLKELKKTIQSYLYK